MLKELNFQKFQFKWKISNILRIPHSDLPQRNCSAPYQMKASSKFWTEIYRNIHTFAFQVLWECSSWASENGAVQMFFLTLTINVFVAVLPESNFYNVEWLEVRKMSFLSETVLICIGLYSVIFFASFRWLLEFLQENLKLVNKLQIWVF